MNYGILHNRGPTKDKARAGPLPMHKIASQMGVDPATLGADAQHIWSMLDDMAATDPAAYQEFIAEQMAAQANAGRKKFTPEPGFVVKYSATLEGGKRRKLFINCCAHECVGLPKNPNNGRNVPRDSRAVPSTSNLEIPLAIGDLRSRTLQGELCTVVDAVFHPWVLERAKWDAKFKMDAMQLASHWVEQEKSAVLHRPGKLIKSLYKGGIGTGVSVVTNDFYVPEEDGGTKKQSNQTDNNAPTRPVIDSPTELLRSRNANPPSNQEENDTPFELLTSAPLKKKLIEEVVPKKLIEEVAPKRPIVEIGKKPAVERSVNPTNSTGKKPAVKKGFLNATKAPLYPTGSTEGRPSSAYVNLLHRSKVVDLTDNPPKKAPSTATPERAAPKRRSMEDIEFDQLCLDAEPDLKPQQRPDPASCEPLFNDEMARLFLQTL
ncbi:hypothetical protein ACHHYP_02339 [Achlya hypogyna]|uniref:PIH1 N-terminal domain-containing protein n=1 Tax=Achlya hypogyna TaxID=1202772 RepID=A0A1V9Z6T8_ACHHY|nr:hypothetical protein ACHHYP_02339 [Achlya hypogyna]